MIDAKLVEETYAAYREENDRLRMKIRTLEKDIKFYINYDTEQIIDTAEDLMVSLQTFINYVSPGRE